MQTIKTPFTATHWPQGLRHYAYHYDTGIELDCFLDYDGPDPGVGWTGRAWLVHAFAGGVEVIEMLKDSIIADIESNAAQAFDDENRENRERGRYDDRD